MATPEQIRNIWESGRAERQATAKMRDRFDGTNSVEGISLTRKDGAVRSNIVLNWYDHITASHVGMLTSDRIEYSIPDNPTDAGLLEFLAVHNRNNLQAVGIEHLTNSIAYGRSVEVHSFTDGMIQISATRPDDWVLVYDENGNIVLGVYRVKIPAYSQFMGKLLEKETIVFYVYDADTVSIFMQGDNALQTVGRIKHHYGQPPLVEMFVKKDRTTHFGKSFQDAANAYNVTRSLLLDEIQTNIDALLATQEIPLKKFLEKDKDGKSALQIIKDTGILALPAGASANWLTRNIDIEKFNKDMEYSRFSIHLLGAVPDIAQNLSKSGAVASISGIALKLLFTPMLHRSKQFAVYYKEGLQKRIDLINIVNERLNRPPLLDVEIKIKTAIPQNSMEWLQYAPALITAEGISVEEVIRQLDFIDDPERVIKEIEAARRLKSTGKDNAENGTRAKRNGNGNGDNVGAAD